MPPQGYYEHFNGVLWDKLALLDPETTSWGFSTPEQGGYMFHPVDLREAARTGIVLDEGKFRTDLPTLIISECCLCYMTAQEADTVIRFFTERIETCGIILYEPTKPNDAFGQMMTSNLAQRGLSMPSIQTYHNLESQMFRLRNLGFNMFQEGANIDFLFLKWIDSQEHVRLQNVQMIDEEEEWKLLAGHYLICWAAKEGEDDDGAFVGWDHLEGEVEAMVKANPVLPQEEHGDGKVYS